MHQYSNIFGTHSSFNLLGISIWNAWHLKVTSNTVIQSLGMAYRMEQIPIFPQGIRLENSFGFSSASDTCCLRVILAIWSSPQHGVSWRQLSELADHLQACGSVSDTDSTLESAEYPVKISDAGHPVCFKLTFQRYLKDYYATPLIMALSFCFSTVSNEIAPFFRDIFLEMSCKVWVHRKRW